MRPLVALVDVEDDSIERAALAEAGMAVIWESEPKPRLVADIPAEARSRVQGLLLRRCDVGARDLAMLPALKVLVRMGVGTDNVDLDACDRAGVVVCNCPDAWVEEVADSTWSLILGLLRRTPALVSHASAGGWTSTAPLAGMRRLRGLRLGIVGLGRIGTAVAARASAFGVRAAFYDPYLPAGTAKGLGLSRAETFIGLMESSDILSFHCPLTAETHHMLGAAALDALPAGRGLHVVNTARGSLLDEAACAEALADGRLAGLAVDVLEEEDRPLQGRPRRPGLLSGPLSHAHEKGLNLLVTPHASFYSDEAFAEMRASAAAEAIRVLRGDPPRTQVNRARHNAEIRATPRS